MFDGITSPTHLLIILVVLVLLFGAKRLPDAARSLGKSMRILKTEVKGLHDDDETPAPAPAPAAALPPAAPAPAPAPAPVAPQPTPVTTPAAPPADRPDSV